MVTSYDRERHEAFIRRTKREQSVFLADVNETIMRTMDACRLDSESWVAKYAMDGQITLVDARKVAYGTDVDALQRKSIFYNGNRRVPEAQLTSRELHYMKEYEYSMKISRLELLQENLRINLYSMSDDLTSKTYEHLRKETIEELRRQAGILGETIPSAERLREQAEVIVNSSFHDQTFSERIWDNQDQLRANLNEGIRRSLMMGQHPTSWMESMKNLFTNEFIGTHDQGGMDYAMQRIAVTETARCQVASQLTAYETAGYDRLEIIAEQAACDEVCKPLDETKVDIRHAMIGENVPPFHPNCRCGTGVLSHRR